MTFSVSPSPHSLINKLPLLPGRFGLPVVGETISLLRDRAFEFKGYRIPQGWGIQYQIVQTHKFVTKLDNCESKAQTIDRILGAIAQYF